MNNTTTHNLTAKTPNSKRNSKFWTNRNQAATVSRYWLQDSIFTNNYSPLNYTRDNWDAETNSPIDNTKINYILLAKYQKAISNFVYILTQDKSIKVKFNSRGINAANINKTITLSPNINANEFDVAVGLALHEASHILYTNFTIMSSYISGIVGDMLSKYPKLTSTSNTYLEHLVKTVFNIIEDRYIDANTYKNAPGYRGYYSALYIKYFGDELITKAFNSQQYRTVTYDNYLFHLVNISNPNCANDTLPGLNDIINTIDLPNILRLHTTQDRFDVTFDVVDIIIREVLNTGNEDNYKESDNHLDVDMGANIDSNSDDEPNQNIQSNPTKLTQGEIKHLKDIVKKQLDLSNNELKKGKCLSQKDINIISSISETDIDIVNVSDSELDVKATDVLVIKSVHPHLIDSPFGISIGLTTNQSQVSIVHSGIAKGRILASKLQHRADDHSVTSTRLKFGKIDRRLLAELGFDNYDIFKQKKLYTYTPSYIHVSIDASGSMHGREWWESLELATTLAMASTLIPNIRVVVTARSTTANNSFYTDSPYIVTLFDSKINNVSHIMNVFPHVNVTSTTPEGLCFSAILKDIIKNSANTDAYFINICDGHPTYNNGIEHTRKQRLCMEQHGIKILGYFISFNGNRGNDYNQFVRMYGEPGKNSFAITSADVNVIAKTMNKKLLEYK